jgi:hypothetical protein
MSSFAFVIIAEESQYSKEMHLPGTYLNLETKIVSLL